MRKIKQLSGERIVKDIKRKTRKQYSAEEKIRIVLDGLRGEESIVDLCRQEGIAQGLYYKWSKEDKTFSLFKIMARTDMDVLW